MKKYHILIAVQVFLAMLVFNYARAQSNLDEAKKAIAESNAIYFQAFVKGDSSLFINRYTKDCWIMPPNAPALSGVDAPLSFYKTAFDKGGVRGGKFITTEIYGDGKEFVTELGSFQLVDDSNTVFENGKYVVLWKKTLDGWKMFRDSFNSDRNK
jgi:ketosteroid isomerase-like protein